MRTLVACVEAPSVNFHILSEYRNHQTFFEKGDTNCICKKDFFLLKLAFVVVGFGRLFCLGVLFVVKIIGLDDS